MAKTKSQILLENIRLAGIMAVPAGILMAAMVGQAAMDYVTGMPAALMHYGLYLACLSGIVLAWWFNLSRGVFILLMVLGGYFFLTNYVPDGPKPNPVGLIGYPAFALLLPLNLFLFSFFEERGVATHYGILRLAFLVIQFTLIDVLVYQLDGFLDNNAVITMQQDLVSWLAYDPLGLDFINKLTPLTPLALCVWLVVFIFFLLKTAITAEPMDAGFVGLTLASLLALHFVGNSPAPGIFFLAAALIMISAVFAESHKMAFYDSLTGIPGRQALMADLKKLSGRYCIAMADIDHFKKFNDTYGHDVGDQVLRMVASHLSLVGGGGKAYRYGGEEFTIVFASRELEAAEKQLDDVREQIAKSDFFLRGQNRPDEDEKARKLRKKKTPAKAKSVRVTVSLGVVEKSRADNTPADAIKRADVALYKAKENGRNCVVTS